MPGTHPTYKDRIPPDKKVIIESHHQLIVTEAYTVEAGATLITLADGRLVVFS